MPLRSNAFRPGLSLPLAGILVILAIAAGSSLSSDARAACAQQMGWYKARADISAIEGEAQGRADFKERERHSGLEQRLHIKVRHAEPRTTYEVDFNGVILGEITTNASGAGKLKLRTEQFIRNNDWEPMPENFPTIIDGDVIEVGLASGVFAVR